MRLATQGIVAVARDPLDGIGHRRQPVERVVAEARDVDVGVGRGRHLAGRRIGGAHRAQDDTVRRLPHLDDPAVGVVAVGRHEAVGRPGWSGHGRRHQAAGSVVGAGRCVAPRVGDRDQVAARVVGVGGRLVETAGAEVRDGREAVPRPS